VPNSQDEKQLRSLSQHVLIKAVSHHGSMEALAKVLGVERRTLGEWIAGESIAPVDTILKAVGPLLAAGDPATFWDRSKPE
jgi:hypothetical protein